MLKLISGGDGNSVTHHQSPITSRPITHTHHQSFITSHSLPVTDYQSPITHHPLPIIIYPLPIHYPYPLSVTHQPSQCNAAASNAHHLPIPSHSLPTRVSQCYQLKISPSLKHTYSTLTNSASTNSTLPLTSTGLPPSVYLRPDLT